jgi:tetratricopeptide (TPR) repeat protein
MACALVDASQAPRQDVTALVEQGFAALQERRFGDALEAFETAARAAPRDPVLAAGAGTAAFMLGQNDAAVDWFQRALKLAPDFADASLLLGDLQYRQGRLQDAIATYEAALKHSPREEAFTRRLAEWKKEAELHRGLFESRGAHFSVLFQGPADENVARRAVELLEAAYWRVGTALTAYPTQPIVTVLYTQEQFRDITRSPEWAAAAYDGRIHVPMRGALDEPEELNRVLTHEFVHAMVATLGGRNVPVWLNEGLATAFEPGGREEIASTLSQTTARPLLARMERSFGRLSAEDARVAYAMSGRAVEKMLQLRGAPAVVALLQDLSRGNEFASAFNLRMAMRYEDFQALMARE